MQLLANLCDFQIVANYLVNFPNPLYLQQWQMDDQKDLFCVFPIDPQKAIVLKPIRAQKSFKCPKILFLNYSGEKFRTGSQPGVY